MPDIVTIRIEVRGLPQPGGSKKSFVPIDRRTGEPFRSKKNGRIVVNTIDDNCKSRNWRNDVKQAALDAMQAAGQNPWLGPVAVEVEFRLPRPKGHMLKSGKLSGRAPAFCTKRPDGTKLWRSTEDALKGVVWLDDCQVVWQSVSKVYAGADPPGATLTIYLLADSFAAVALVNAPGRPLAVLLEPPGPICRGTIETPQAQS